MSWDSVTHDNSQRITFLFVETNIILDITVETEGGDHDFLLVLLILKLISEERNNISTTYDLRMK